MNLGLVERVGDLVWEDTRRKTRNHFGYSGLMCALKYVVINEHIVSQEGKLQNSANQTIVGDTSIYLVSHITVQTTDCRQVSSHNAV
jgi:hypothetical protein